MAAKPAKSKKARRAWNKGVKVGQRDALSPAEVKKVRRQLASRGDAGLRDLALFSVAIDTMLHASVLLRLTVKDVRQKNGSMRSLLEIARANGDASFRCTVSKATADVLEHWIVLGNKKPGDYLFPGRGNTPPRPMTTRQMSRLLKSWIEDVGLDPVRYGTESLRRTRALHILNNTGDMEAVRALLGHSSITSTANFLRVTKHSDPIAISRAYEI